MSTPKTPGNAGKRLQSAKGSAGGPGSGAALVSSSSLLDVFPVWSEQQVSEKEDKNAGKYEDPLGVSLPPSAMPFCDAWKRAEELLQGLPAVPVVCLRPAAADGPVAADTKKGKEIITSRELDGKLYAGHETFERLLAVISYIMAAEKSFKKGEYLWELISPKDKDGLPCRSPTGRYRVKLFLLDTWRSVLVDDRIPLDLFGRPLLVGSRPLQLWPLLLCKAIVKVMAVYRSLDMTLPHQVAAFQMLTGWPQEDLLDALGGTQLAGGALFDRLEYVLPGPSKQVQGLPAIASCCLLLRSKPQRAPPRLVVLSGASAVGRSQLVARLLSEFPDKFGATISHTSRPPREHEVDGKDYYFTTKQQLLGDARAKKFLEAARVTVHSRPANSSAAAAAAAPPQPLSYWYGTSLATVREVAATGKLCVMSLDVQGAEALRSNPRIDGLYLYVGTSSGDVLAQRQKQRLWEAASTLSKRLAWAKQQLAKSSTLGLFDNVIPHTDLPQAYADLKEAISKLSPIIRNRLRGLPAYVLDYSDLIPPNSVEKPFLKPVILAGQHTGERRRLLEMLVEEFPDVFDFPCQYTTRPPDLHSKHVGADDDELQLVAEQSTAAGSSLPDAAAGQAEGGSPGAGDDGLPVSQQPAAGSSGPASGGSFSSGSSNDGQGSSPGPAVLGPSPHVVTKEEFDAAVTSGQLLEHHPDLFTHPLAAHRHGHSMDDIQEIIKAGKLPLLELEAEQTELVKVTKGIDCLSVFLAPPSLEEHQQRLQLWATETDEEIADRGAAAAAELAAVQSNSVFDQVLVNDDLDQGYAELKAAISSFRPDLIPPAAHEAAAKAARQAAASTPVPLLVAGPAGAGREQLVQQLLQCFPQRFALPRQVTDRKPGKGEKEIAADVEFVKPDVLAKMGSQGQVVWSLQDAAGSSTAVTAEAVSAILTSGKMAVLDVGSATAEQLHNLKQHPSLKQAFIVYVSREAALKASLAAAGAAEAAVASQLANLAANQEAVCAAQGLLQACVTNEEAEEAFTQLQVPLSSAYAWAMPPLLQPLVVAGPFGSGKRAVLQRLVALLPQVLAVPKVVTSKPHVPGKDEGMEVVSVAVAQQMRAEGQFLVHQEVSGHIYGITSSAVRKLQAMGKLPLLELDRVQDVEQLRASGFQASYLYLQPHSLEALQARITAAVMANPPLYYEPEEAAAKAAAEAVQEAGAAAARPELFDALVSLNPQDLQTAIGKLGLELHKRYPSAVPSNFVWGFGRPLWDPTVRVLGLKPLRIIVLGPAASGKSMQCSMLAERFAIPHINVGDLLYAEVAAKTPLGLEAQRHMDSSKTVPDKLLMRLLLERLQHRDCQAHGWVLDGFPHTRKQALELEAAGHIADKVILLKAPHTLLLNRVKYRRIDYSTGKVYHLAEAGALSEAIRPLKPDGTVDTDTMARLSVRHDDSPQNVANRLALWDRQVQGLRAAYEDVILRLPAAGPPAALYARVESFVQLEAVLPSGPEAVGRTCIWPLVESWQLEELSYRVVSTIRFKRQQLVQLHQLDGKLFWCDLKELAGNCSCMLLAHNPGGLSVVKASKRLDTSCIQQQQLLLVDSPEPFRLVATLSMGPQHLAVPTQPATTKVFVLVGPAGAGRSTLAQLLLSDSPSKLVPVPLLTSRAPQPLDVIKVSKLSSQLMAHLAGPPATQPVLRPPAGSTAPQPAALPAASTYTPAQWPGTDLLKFVPEQQFRLLQQSQQLLGLHQHLGHSYAVPVAAVESAAQEGKAALVVGSVHLAEQLRSEQPELQIVSVYVDADIGSLDQHLRQQVELDEQVLQALLADAAHQRHRLQALQEQHTQLLQDRLQGQQQASTSAAQTPAGSGAKGGSPPGKLVVQLPQVTLPSTPAPPSTRAGQQQQLQQPWQWQSQQQQQQQHGGDALAMQEPWLFCVTNADKQLQVCYTHVKGLLARYWPCKEQFQPGLLLLQHHPASAALSAAAADPPTSAKQSGGGAGVQHSGAASIAPAAVTAAAAAATAGSGAGTAPPTAAHLVNAIAAGCSSLGLDEDTFHSSSTILRLRALTAASTQLVLPRGRHLLQLHCCQSQLHTATFHASTDFTLDTADKLLPLACKMHVTRESGDTPALPAGSRQLLFRYLIKPSQPCTVSFQYQATSAALQASTQLLLLEVATGRRLPQLQQPAVQLMPTDKGYLLVGLAQTLIDVPPGSWSVALTSSCRLPALTEVPCSRQVAFSGVYACNTKAVLARFVVSPTTNVNIALLAQLRLTASHAATAADGAGLQDHAAPLSVQPGSSTSSVTSPDSTKVPLSYAVEVFDTCGVKEVAWHANYQLLTSVQSQSNGCASIPNLHLAPGRYLLVLQLQQDGSSQWIDPDTGSTAPVPEWQLRLLPSADDKACSIVQDDAWERHFAATKEAWQQQAMAAAAGAAVPAGVGRPGSSPAKAAVAAAKDRAKFAQAAFERHLAAAAAAAADHGSAQGGNAAAAAPSSARSAAAAAVSMSSSGSSQQPAAVAAAVHAPSSTAGGRKAVSTAAKGRPAGAQISTTPAGVSVPAPAAAAGGQGVSFLALDASAVPGVADSSSCQAAPTQLWPGAVPAAPRPAKQPSEVVVRQVKSNSTDVLQLSPADQVKVLATPGESSASATSLASAAMGIGSGSPPGSLDKLLSRRSRPTMTANPRVLSQADLTARLGQLQVVAASKSDQATEAANIRSRLQAAAAQQVEQQTSAFVNWRDQTLAEHQAALQRKQAILQSLFPPPPPAPAAVIPAAQSQALHKGADKATAKAARPG